MKKRINVRVVKSSQGYIKYTSRPICLNSKVFENDLAAIHEKKLSITLNKPIYVGFKLLEISKREMYNCHCNLMITKFSIRLLFTDTDSFCCDLHEKYLYKKMCKYKKLFDLSNFPGSNKYYSSYNKKIVGKMKDEYGGKSIVRFVGLKSKMYSILDESNNKKSTNKCHNALTDFQEFYDTLFNKKILRHTMRGIKSKNHNFGTYETNKISLSCFDDKGYILKNGINT